MPKELGQKLLRCAQEPGGKPIPGLYSSGQEILCREAAHFFNNFLHVFVLKLEMCVEILLDINLFPVFFPMPLLTVW